MDNVLILISIILIITFIISFNQTDNLVSLKTNKILNTNTNILPISIKETKQSPQIQKHKDIYLYEEDINYINNKGFINEIIYKPSLNNNSLIFEDNKIIPDIDLNDNSYAESQDLPIGNINVQYLLKNNTSKLTL